MLPLNSLWIIDWAFPEKENQQGGRGHTFLKTPWNFLFLLLKPLEIPDKTKLHPWKFHKIALDPLEIPRPSHQDPWKFHIIFFLVTLLNSFCYFFDTPRNSIPILYPFPHPVWFSSGIAHLTVDDGQLASYLPACKLRRFLRAWFAPAVRWKVSLDFSFWFLMRISRILYLCMHVLRSLLPSPPLRRGRTWGLSSECKID